MNISYVGECATIFFSHGFSFLAEEVEYLELWAGELALNTLCRAGSRTYLKQVRAPCVTHSCTCLRKEAQTLSRKVTQEHRSSREGVSLLREPHSQQQLW